MKNLFLLLFALATIAANAQRTFQDSVPNFNLGILSVAQLGTTVAGLQVGTKNMILGVGTNERQDLFGKMDITIPVVKKGVVVSLDFGAYGQNLDNPVEFAQSAFLGLQNTVAGYVGATLSKPINFKGGSINPFISGAYHSFYLYEDSFRNVGAIDFFNIGLEARYGRFYVSYGFDPVNNGLVARKNFSFGFLIGKK